MRSLTLTTPAHDKNMARDFLAGLDPNASKFTFQFFGDRVTASAEIFHGTLDEVWPKVQALNTPTRRCGAFVTINETDFKGRSKENILRPRALFVDADNDEQVKRCIKMFYACGAAPSRTVKSGRGLHFYFCTDVPRDQFTALQKALANKVETDPAVHDLPRVMRLPGTLHLKDPTNPRLVKLSRSKKSPRWKFSELVATLGLSSTASALKPYAGATPAKQSNVILLDPALFPKRPIPPEGIESLAEGIEREEMPPLDPRPILMGCGFFREAFRTGGSNYAQPLWNLTTLGATFMEKGEQLAHNFGNKHPTYTPDSTKAMYERKMRERQQKGLGWPSCNAIQTEGCKLCATCPHFKKIKSPLNLAHQQQTPPAEPSFVDPYAEFAGPEFPLDVLPPTLAKFVDAEHRAMGADPSAITMAALTTIAGAMHAETLVRAGEGWWERPILWTALVGQPSTKKSPIIDKTTKPLSRIDHERAKRWQQEYAIWQQNQK